MSLNYYLNTYTTLKFLETLQNKNLVFFYSLDIYTHYTRFKRITSTPPPNYFKLCTISRYGGRTYFESCSYHDNNNNYYCKRLSC